jgi:transcriptional regulator of arginine metabolism
MKPSARKNTHNTVGSALRQLLLEGNVGTHEDICAALQKKGFPVNQPKVSRLLHKLGAVKVTNAEGQNIYRLPHEHGLIHEFNRPTTRIAAKQWVLDVVNNTTLIIIHTTPGAAGLIAREIDRHQLALGILGTIAGDDTIFVAPKEIKKIEKIVGAIKLVLAL